MNRREALDFLRFGDSTERLEAAVVLRRAGLPRDIHPVRRAAQRELNEQVRLELIKTRSKLEAISEDQAEPPPDASPTEELSDAAYARGVQDTTLEIVHEIRRLVGFARGSARKEISGFESSRTRADFSRLTDLLGAVERLGQVTEVGVAEDFDLGGLLADVTARLQTQIEDEGQSADEAFELAGPKELIVSGDAGLVEICVTNGLQNAVEATGRERLTVVPVSLTWGTTDIDSWVAVLDRGPGLPTNLPDPFAFARTTKSEHLGVGLTVARRAARSLGGHVLLSTRTDGGAVFELRWPHEREA